MTSSDPTATLAPSLARLARENDGLVVRAHLAARRISPAVARAAVQAKQLHRVRPGVLVTTQRWAAANGHERYVLTVKGLLLAHPDWIASHHAALALHGLPLYDVDLELVDVAAAVGTSKRRDGLHVHIAAPAQIEHVSTTAPRVLPVADACVLTAAASGFEAGVVAMDAALKRRLVTREALVAALDLPGVRYGIGTVRAAIEATDPKAESPGETLTRLILRRSGAVVRSQVWVEDGEGTIGRVDFLVGDRVVVEFDGAVKYEGAEGKLELMREKKREERLRDAGFRVIRVTWADLRHPERLLARVGRELAAA